MRCEATTLTGKRCKNACTGRLCGVHSRTRKSPTKRKSPKRKSPTRKSPVKFRFSEAESKEQIKSEIRELKHTLANIHAEQREEGRKIAMDTLSHIYPEIVDDIDRAGRNMSVMDVVEEKQGHFPNRYESLMDKLNKISDKYTDYYMETEERLRKAKAKLKQH